MTIIKPALRKNYLSFLALVVFLGLGFGVSFIFEYNSFATNRLETSQLQSQVVALESANAELKNTYYSAIAVPNLQPLVSTNNLILDKHPEYLNANLWLTASTQ